MTAGASDPQQVLAKAEVLGLPSPEDVSSPGEIYELMFHPGFSTAEEITELSGRGVGLDVVRQNIESLRGTVEVESVLDRGTTFRINLPLTLAIIDGMNVVVAGEVFVLPLLSIVESMRPAPHDLKTVEGKGELLRFRNSYLPLVRLNRLFHLSGAVEDPCQGLIMIIESLGKRFGLLVDDVFGPAPSGDQIPGAKLHKGARGEWGHHFGRWPGGSDSGHSRSGAPGLGRGKGVGGVSRQDILPAMAAEAPALLRSVEEGLLALEIGESVREASRSVFRSLHSVWAGASLAGLENLGRLSGRMELTLRLLLMDELAPRQHLVDALLQAADLLATMLTHLPEAETVETGGCLRALEAALSAELPPELIERLKPVPVPNHPYWLAAPWLMDSVLEQEYGLFKVILSKEAQQSGHALYAHLGELLTLGQLLACAPDASQRLELLYASPLETALLGEALSLPRQYLLPLQRSGQSPSGAEPGLVDKQTGGFSPARIQAPLGSASAPTAAMAPQDKTSLPDSGEPPSAGSTIWCFTWVGRPMAWKFLRCVRSSTCRR